MNGLSAYLRIALFHLLVLLAVSAGNAIAVQIEPNPNPSFNTISVTPPIISENLKSFSNLGAIDIHVNAALRNADFLQNSGTITNAGVLINQGVVSNFFGGTLRLSETGQYIQPQSGTPATTATANVGTFTNAGQVQLGAGTSFSNVTALRGVLIGDYIQEARGTTQLDGTFSNSGGRVNNQGALTVGTTGEYGQQLAVAPATPGTTTNSGTFTNAGTVHIGEGTSFSNTLGAPSSTGQYIQQASGTTMLDGTFSNSGGRVNNQGVMTVGTTGEYNQSRHPVVGQAGTTTNSGSFTNAGAVRIGEGTGFSNAPGGQYVQQTGGTTQINGEFDNRARVSNAGAITVGTTGQYLQLPPPAGGVPPALTSNSGSFTNAGTTVIGTGTTFTNQGSVVNSGTFQVAALGQVSGSGSYVQNAAAAQTTVNGTFAHNITLQAGTLTGTGTIQGAVQNSGGLLLPGNNGLGTLTIKGQYAQGFNGIFGVNLAGLNQGVTYGLLAVQGTGVAVTLGGNLKVGLLNGFSPSLGNTFGILTCTGCTISGGLRNLSLPTLASGLDWSVGFVDGLGTLQLAVVSTPAASAPEPGTFLLVGVGFVALVGWRRRKIKARSAQTVAL